MVCSAFTCLEKVALNICVNNEIAQMFVFQHQTLKPWKQSSACSAQSSACSAQSSACSALQRRARIIGGNYYTNLEFKDVFKMMFTNAAYVAESTGAWYSQSNYTGRSSITWVEDCVLTGCINL